MAYPALSVVAGDASAARLLGAVLGVVADYSAGCGYRGGEHERDEEGGGSEVHISGWLVK